MNRLSASPWSGTIPRSVVFYFLFCAIYGTVFVPLVAREVGASRLRSVVRGELWSIAGASVAGFASYTLILEALRTAPVSYVVAVRQVSVLIAVALAVAGLGERPARARIVGATATVVGIALIALFP
jgi:drug/metabolite transporter (DMT)-like permease